MRNVLFGLCLLIVLASCGTTGNGSSANTTTAMSYSDAVRQMRRPPTASQTTPEGDLIATWETEVPEGTRRLALTFGPDRRLKSQQTTTISRR